MRMAEPVNFYTNKKSANMVLVMGLVFSAICYVTTIFWVAHLQKFVTVTEFQIMAVIICTGVLITMLVAYKKKLKPRVAVTVSDEGINDATYELSNGLIKWEDLKEVGLKDGMVILVVANPQQYIDKAKNPGMKRLLQNYQKKYNTPVVLNPSYLIASDKEVADAISAKFVK